MVQKNTSLTQPSAGVLHFDVSIGCTAQVLIGALAELKGNVVCIKKGFESAKVTGVVPSLRQDMRKNLSGAFVDFVVESTGASINPALRVPFRLPSPKKCLKRRPFWARAKESTPLLSLEPTFEPKNETPSPVRTAEDDLFSSWLRNENASLGEIKILIENSALGPVSKALALKTVNLMIKSLTDSLGHDGSLTQVGGHEGARILCEIIAFSQLIETLDPLAMSATRVAMSTPEDFPAANVSSLERTDLLLMLAEGVPTLDRIWPAPFADCTGLALLRSVVSRFGARGESIVLRHGRGIGSSLSEPMLTAKVLWCAPASVSSRAEHEANDSSVTLPSVEVSAVVGQGVDVADLLRRLSGVGMKSIITWQAFESLTYPRLMLRGLMPYLEVQLAIEALLITGEAIEVNTSLVENQALQHRTVSVPYGRGQKMQACRVNEWLWSGKILRADPDPTDLSLLVKASGLAQEVVRADVLAAWRKWRKDEN